jgi:predicted Zn-dependent protease
MDRDTAGYAQMGGEGVPWTVASQYNGGKHVFQNLGEGTWYHSGSLAIRQAVAYHRQSKSKKAIATINKAIAARPNDPFLRDLKGEILMQSRQFKSAASAYAQGQKQAPREALILAGYGRALLASGQVKPALTALERARSIDYRDGIMLRDLATAYAKTGQRGMAALVTAERYALRGRLKDAGIHAKRASDLLARGSGPWQRAQDVLLASERFAKKRK